jgi:hypothetical protein
MASIVDTFILTPMDRERYNLELWKCSAVNLQLKFPRILAGGGISEVI